MSKPILQQFLLTLMPSRVSSILADTRFFFIVGIGRSGSTFLSHLLNRVPTLAAYHETASDRDALVQAFWNPTKADTYLSGSRQRLMAARIMQSKCNIYGEVNSYLRYHVDAIERLWSPRILHLVRDGRAVVRSAMNRTAFTPADASHTGKLYPRLTEAWAEEWSSMDRFARVCWYWADANRYLLQRQLPVIRLEDITTSYDHFTQQVLIPLNITLPYEIWKEEVTHPKNPSKKTSFPAWQDWKSEQILQFKRICGSTMNLMGYDI